MVSITYVTNAFSKKFGGVYKRCGRGVKKAQGVAECLGLASSIYPTCENWSTISVHFLVYYSVIYGYTDTYTDYISEHTYVDTVKPCVRSIHIASPHKITQ